MPLPFLLPILYVGGYALLGGVIGGAVGYALGTLWEVIFDDEVFLQVNDTIRERYPTFYKVFMLFEPLRHLIRATVVVQNRASDTHTNPVHTQEISPDDLPPELRAQLAASGQVHQEDITEPLRQRMAMTS